MSIPSQFENATKIDFRATAKKLDEINSSNNFVVESSLPTIDKLTLTIKKSKKCFSFRTGPVNLVPDMVKYQNIAYGFGKPFRLINTENWYIHKGVSSHTFSPGRKYENKGKINELSSNLDVRKHQFFRMLIPQNGSMYNRPRSFLESTSLCINEIYSYGLVSIEVGSKNYRFYDHSSDVGKFLIIDCLEKQTFKQFEQVTGAIRYSFALISGYLQRDESYVMISSSEIFNSISGFVFKRELDSIDSGKHIICPWILQDYLKERISDRFLPAIVFSNLVSLTLTDKSVLRAVQILIQSNNLPLEICTAAYSVCLETIKNVVIDQNAEK